MSAATATRVIVCGSRGWHDRERISERLAELPGDTTVVVGYDPIRDSPRGADRIAYQEAQKLGLKIENLPASDFVTDSVSWKRAPLERNEEMARRGADLCVCFWDQRSTGTAHMRDQARRHGIAIEMHIK